MSAIFGTPVITTNTVTTVQITRIDNNIEGEYVNVEYVTLLEDGTPYQRGSVKVRGYDDIKVLYAETDTVMATGKTFEEASAEILYNKVLVHLGV